MVDYAAQQKAYKAQLRKNAKEACKILRAAGIDIVAFHYDGCGDSGQIEHTEALSIERTGKAEKPTLKVSVDNVGDIADEIYNFGNEVINCKSKGISLVDDAVIAGLSKVLITKPEYYGGKPELLSPVDALEYLVYEFLPGGWEINEGAFGTVFVFTELNLFETRQETRVEATEHEFDSGSI